ncbi:pentatricopeptide repeat-containing protein At3g58590 isoform X1 [Lactuca sativa]|uniref:pentatricopeptide repeat-containing protein At3g58590 isoform X1 n=2 Tax=Lactuca sativa TaxID=4236 RepID=UPI000CC04C8B|nr:pentatricopeptide repeat-containing protein At3g58590 isoform X1 [Lactuca sativa]
MGFSLPQIEFFHNNLISLYATLGHISIARKVFDEMPHRNVVSYNTMIGAYSRNKEDNEACNLFADMRYHGFLPTQFTYASLFSCDSLNTDQGFCLQSVAMKSGLLFADTFVGTALLGLFGRQGYIREAFMVFDEMPFKNLVTWNAIISLCGHQGFTNECMLMFSHFMKTEIKLSEASFVGVLTGFQSKQNLKSGEQIHALVIKFGVEHSVAIANSLVKMYGKCEGNTFLAEKMFQFVSNKDLMTWNTIIGIVAKGEKPIKAIEFFSKMCINGFLPNKITFLNAITSCSRLDNLTYGELIHSMIIKNQFEKDSLVATSLVNLYAKHDRLDYAHQCFDKIHDKNLVSWNTLIHGYSDKQCSSSLLLMIKMIHSGISPNEFSFSSVIKSLLATELKEIHSLVIKTGFHSNEYITSSLMTSYANNGFPSDALRFFQDSKIPQSIVHMNVICGMYNRNGEYHKTQELFCEVGNPDIVSWNILIEACSRNGDYKEAFELFHHMLIDRIRPDNYTYVSLITISTNLCNLLLGSSLHGLMIKSNFNHFDIMVNNLMIDMYGKCGSIRGSIMIFEEMRKKNVISWTVLISGLGLHGFGKEAIEKFKEMEKFGVKPDKIAFMAVFSGCRHVGLVKEGMELFEIMKEKYGIEPEMEHYLLVVDLMARYGDLKEAEKLILGMPFLPNASIWRSFLHGCNRAKSLVSQIQAC